MQYDDRTDAGRQLAEHLKTPLDVLVVRKLGAWQPHHLHDPQDQVAVAALGRQSARNGVAT